MALAATSNHWHGSVTRVLDGSATGPTTRGSDPSAQSLLQPDSLARVNATDTALATIDGTILAPAVGAIDKQFKDQPPQAAGLIRSASNLRSAPDMSPENVMFKLGNGSIFEIMLWKFVPKQEVPDVDDAPKGQQKTGKRSKNADIEAAKEGEPEKLEDKYDVWYLVRLDPSVSPAPAGWLFGRQVELQVPTGTAVYERTGDDGYAQIADLTEEGQRVLIAKGGLGGHGNASFATATNRAPRKTQPGLPGEEKDLRLHLKLLADVGLVGFPNAGKSTMISRISAARPKIADYPFTTLVPNLGVVGLSGDRSFVVADIPGLIEGAHQNVGLGHEFLRHIERCKILVLLLDMAGTDNRQPWDDYHSLLEELEQYDPALVDKPRLVVANKMDETAAEENLKKFKRKIRKTPVITMAAAFDEGIDQFKKLMREAVEQTEDKPAISPPTPK